MPINCQSFYSDFTYVLHKLSDVQLPEWSNAKTPAGFLFPQVFLPIYYMLLYFYLLIPYRPVSALAFKF